MAAPLPAVAAATAVTLTTILTALLSTIIDANPSLYVYSTLLLTERKLHQTWHRRNVLLVGGSSGIGAELAELLSGHGANVIVTGRDRRRLHSVVERCRSNVNVSSQQRKQEPQIIQPLPLDLTAPDRVLTRAIDAAAAALPGGTILFRPCSGEEAKRRYPLLDPFQDSDVGKSGEYSDVAIRQPNSNSPRIRPLPTSHLA